MNDTDVMWVEAQFNKSDESLQRPTKVVLEKCPLANSTVLQITWGAGGVFLHLLLILKESALEGQQKSTEN